jgi:beta-mannosidase
MRGGRGDRGRIGRWIGAAGSDILGRVSQATDRSAVRSPLLAAGVLVGMSLGVPASGAVSSGAGGTASEARVSVELRGPWVFRQATHAGKAAAASHDWLPATVPGCVHTDLLANHKIADPFVGMNEKDQQWIDKEDWEYRTTFTADDALLARERVELDFLGLDTYAEVFVNGAPVLTADNMFRSWRVAVKSHLHAGENTLLIRFRSPIKHVMPAYERLGYILPANNDQATPMVSMYTRKAPYHYGWDWGPRFVTSGVWRPVRLEAWDAARIDDVHALQTSLTDARATLRVTTTIVASHAGRAQLRLSLAGGGPLAEAGAPLKAGRNDIDVDVAIERPERWWPNGLGAPHLYTIAAELSVAGVVRDTRTVRVGLRTLEVIHRDDKDGKSFTVEVNGAPVFMKGANYIPSDSFLDRVTFDRYRFLVKSAADTHMNMLRVWGGGIYEDDRFYDLCDEMGILVWQDFMFACAMYPGDAPFIENVRQEAIENVRRLRNHPSLALWAGNNEMEVAWKEWGWQAKFHLNKAAQDKIWRAYKRVFYDVLPKVVAEEDPGRFYTRSSPSANDDRIQANKVGYGDMHYWGVWHAEAPYTDYGPNTSRFMSEYGFQSFPELPSVARYATPADYDIESPVMLSHQRHPRGNPLVRTYMDRDFRKPKDFASFLYMSQVLQATVIGYAAEAHRRRMPYNQGSLYWQLDDCWPVASWAGIDYFGRWKALHYAARRFFAPILLSTVEEAGEIHVYGVSDLRAPTRGQLTLRLVDFEGRELWRQASDVTLAANASAVLSTWPRASALQGADPAHVVLVAELASSLGGEHLARSLFYFEKTKDLALPEPELSVAVTPHASGAGASVRVAARRLARAVRLEADPAPARREEMFSDNYFDLLPGEAVTLEWNGAVPRVKATSIRDTY